MAFSITLNYSRRLFLWLVIYSWLLVACCVVFQYHREKHFKAEELNAQLQLINMQLIDNIRTGTFAYGSIPESPFVDLRISIVDTGGHVIFDNTLDSLPHANHLNRKEIGDAIMSGTGYTVRRHSETADNNYFYSAMKSDSVIVRTAVPYTMTLHEILKADYGFLRFMAAIATAMCVVGYFATRRIGRHILRLKQFAREAEQGKRIYDYTPFPHDELGDISNNIVRLYAKLQQAISDRDREHKRALKEQDDKARLKKQLTNNINHELKTPVAALKVCLETVARHPDLDSQKRMDFITRGIEQAQRLESLLADVSLLTRLEDGKTAITKTDVDLSDVIRQCRNDLEPIAAAKGISIDIDQPDRLHINANRELLASVFHNTLTNSLNHSGCTHIRIRVRDAGNEYIRITVSDDGCGIPAEHLPYIFERFYRVDKGRSRKAGGTGLGLAIVKNAVTLHGGNITAHNTPEGLELTFTLHRL